MKKNVLWILVSFVVLVFVGVGLFGCGTTSSSSATTTTTTTTTSPDFRTLPKLDPIPS